MHRSKIIIFIFLTTTIADLVFLKLNNQSEKHPEYVNSVLAIRSFKNKELRVNLGDTQDYEVEVGEEFKITWKVSNLIENGQILFSGPKGIGGGIIPVTNQVSAEVPFKSFKAEESGQAIVKLTVTGPDANGIASYTSTIRITIK